MFFGKIETWSKKKIWVATIVCYLIYSCLLLVGPAVTIMLKYDIFKHAENNNRLSGIALLFLVVFLLYAYIMACKFLNKLPQVTINEQRFKFGTQTALKIIPLGAAIFALWIARDNVILAFNTALICLAFILAAVVFDGLFIKFIDAEWNIRSAAKFDKEKAKRSDVV